MHARVFLLLSGLWLCAPSAVAGEEGGGVCLAPAAAAQAVRDGRVERLADVTRSLVGDILHADLCDGGTGLVYRVVVIDDLGRVRRVVLDARTGRLVYDGR
ncbi:MAG: hypothetical protein GX458_00290 [Phyllobacteriaceae bacterium]|nr:hypothetical protein [Phyllobacteriaceae bacterium]